MLKGYPEMEKGLLSKGLREGDRNVLVKRFKALRTIQESLNFGITS
jgi:hypothetical protein